MKTWCTSYKLFFVLSGHIHCCCKERLPSVRPVSSRGWRWQLETTAFGSTTMSTPTSRNTSECMHRRKQGNLCLKMVRMWWDDILYLKLRLLVYVTASEVTVCSDLMQMVPVKTRADLHLFWTRYISLGVKSLNINTKENKDIYSIFRQHNLQSST